MSVFADSSALVKLYSDESGHERVRSLTVIVVSDLARVEVPSAIWRKERLGELTPEEAALLTAAFEADYLGAGGMEPRFAPVATSAAILDAAAALCRLHDLRAFVAVQLASALAARVADPTCDTIAAFDSRLRRAAIAEGFSLVPA
ncbi:MAG: type II toxin-antitoxin system VapC family toxin [Acidimicrobiales bacterium]